MQTFFTNNCPNPKIIAPFASRKSRKVFSVIIILMILFVETFTSSSQAQVTVTGGTSAISGSPYPTLTAAIDAINTGGSLTAPVTVDVPSGYTETLTGKIILTMTGSSSNTLTIQKNGAGANPILTAYTGTVATPSNIADGFFVLAGVDYVTIDGIDLQEAAVNTTTTTVMEFGYGLFMASSTDGSQNNTIKNCTITLNRIQNTAWTAPGHNGSIGIAVNNGLYTATGAITQTVASGTNSFNKFYSNTIQNCNAGISFVAYAAPSPFTLGDTGNDVGGSSASTGNTILNFGGGAATNPATGIFANNQWDFNVSYNNINSNNGAGVNHAGILRGIFLNAALSASVECTHNTITVKGGGTTSALTGIENVFGSTAAGNTVNLNNNTIQNCTYTTATTATFTGILTSSTATNVNANANQVINNSIGNAGTASSAIFQGIYSSGSAVNFTANSNTISGNTNQNNFGTMYCIRASTSTLLYIGNTVSNNGFPNNAGATSTSLYGFYDGSSPVNETYQDNNINNLTTTGTSTATGHAIYGIYNLTATGTKEFSGNSINNLSFTSSSTGYATVAGIRNAYATTSNIFNNTIHSLSSTGASPTVAGLYLGSSSITTINAYNNIIGNLTTPSSTGHTLFGIYCGTAGTNINLYYNTVFLDGTSTGTNFSSSAVYMSSTTPTVTLQNNILVNLSTPTGTGFAAAIRRTSATFTGWSANSNNNLLYAGTPSANNVIYYNGTTAYGSDTSPFGPEPVAGSFLNFVSPRESNSFTETISSTPGVFFQSLTGPATGSSSTFLHLVNGLTTFAESGGIPVSGITEDYDGNTRNVTTPDMGADEFAGTLVNVININSLSINPPGNLCVANGRTVTANVTIGDNAATSITLYYSFNGASPVAITMTGGTNTPNTTSDWTAVIPVATPADANVTWSVTAVDPLVTKITGGTAYRDEPLTGASASITGTPNPVCAGSPIELTAHVLTSGSEVTIGTGATTSTTYSGPFYSLWNNKHHQMLIKASELTGAGLGAGNITGIIYHVTTIDGTDLNLDFSIKMANTTATDMTSFVTTGLVPVYSIATFSPVVGENLITFSSPFTWDGTSNVVIEICFGNPSNTNTLSGGSKMDATSYISARVEYNTSSTGGPISGSALCGSVGNNVATYSTRPHISFIGIGESTLAGYVWNDGSSDIGTGNPFTTSPLVNTSYTVTATDANGCTILSTPYAVTTLTGPTPPNGNNSNQCGTGVPGAFVTSSGGGAGFSWYDAQLGGNLLQNGGALYTSSISATTTFWVSESDGTCESLRTPVTATVTAADPIDALADDANPCLNTTIQLSAVNTASSPVNNYSYTWTANPSAGSGIATFITGSPVNITPTSAGTYTYTVTGDDGDCSNVDEIVVEVKALPEIYSVTADPNEVCAGETSTLTGFIGSPPGTSTFGTQTTTLATAGSPYRSGAGDNYQVKTQLLILASELSGAGMAPGATINSLGFTTTTTSGSNVNFEIRMGHTNVSALTSTFLTSSMQTVFTTPLFTPVPGLNTHIFTSEFVWDGVSNIVIETRQSNQTPLGTSTVAAFTTPAISSVQVASLTGFAAATGTTNAARALITLGYGNDFTGNYTWQWDPGALAGSSVAVSPFSTTTYTATATDPSTSCSGTATVTLTIHDLPPAPSGNNSEQCGTAIPLASISSNSGAPAPVFIWYDAPTGGTSLQTGTSSTYLAEIDATTTFYVNEISSFGCEGPRTAVMVTVSEPDVLTVTASDMAICLGGSTNISSSYVPNFNTYATFELTASDPASGVNGTVALTPGGPGTVPYTVTPTYAGTYTYTITATDPDKGCVTVSMVEVTVTALPLITNASATPSTVCAGDNAMLSAVSIPANAGNATVGSGATTSTTYPAAFYSLWSNKHEQIMIRASELTAAGLVTGYITSLSFPTTAGTLSPMDFTIKMANTASPDMSAFLTTGLTQVYYAATQPQVANTDNTLILNTPFNWDGTSNIVIDICFGNSGSSATMSCTAPADNTSYVSVIKTHTSAATSAATACPNITSQVLTYSVRPKIIIEGQVGVNNTSDYNWTWNPGNIDAGTSGTTTVNPVSTTTYTATATDPVSGCSVNSSPVALTANPLPAAPATNTPVTRCGPGSVTLTATGTGGTLNWYDVAVAGISLQTGSSYTTTVSGNTSFWVAETSAQGCEGPRSQVNITVTPAPALVITPAGSTTFCDGGSVSLNAATGSDPGYVNFTWDPATGLSATTGAVVTASPSDTTEYTVTADDGLPNGCANTASITITVNPNPVVSSVTATPATICAGESSELEAKSNIGDPLSVKIGTGTGGFTGAANPYWNSNSADGSKFQFLYKAADLINIGLTPGNISGIKFKITTNPIPAAALFNNFTISMGHSTVSALTSTWQPGMQLVVNPIPNHIPVTGDNLYNFDFPFVWDGTSNIIIQVCYDNDPNNTCTCTGGTCAVEYTSGQSYASGAYYYETNSSNPNRDMCGSTAAATTQTNLPNVIFVRGFSNNTSLYNWQWNPGAIPGAIVTVNPSATTTYTVTATDPGTGCTTTGETTVTVNPVPAAPVTNSPVTRCGPGTVTLTATNTGGTMNWYDVASGGTPLFTGDSYSPTVISNTTFYVAEAYVAGCEGPRTSVDVIITSSAPLVITPTGSTTICEGGSVSLDAASNSDPTYVNFNWSPAADLSSSTGAVVTASPVSTVTYTVAADDGAGCANVANVTITVNPNPEITSASASPDTICSGSNSTLTAASGSGGPGVATIGTQTTTTQNGSPIRAGNATPARTQLLYTAAELSSAGFTAGNFTSVAFNFTTASGGTLPDFTIRMGHTAATVLTSTLQPVPSTVVFAATTVNPPTVTGMFTLTFTTPFLWDGVSNVLLDFCHGLPNPSAGSGNVSASTNTGNMTCYVLSTSACTATTGTVQTTRPLTTFGGQMGVDNTGNYNWTWNPGNIVTGTTGIAIVSPAVTTSYTATATDPVTGCSSVSAPVTITVAPVTANASAMPSTPVCAGTSVTLDAGAAGGPPLSYSWNDGSSVIGTSASLIVNPGTTTTYTVTVTDGCSNTTTSSVTVTVNPLPNVQLSPATATYCVPGGSPVILTATGAESYTWLPTTGLSATTGDVVNATPAVSTTYIVTGEGSNGCTNSATATITVSTNVTGAIASATPATLCAGSTLMLSSSADAIPTTGYTMNSNSGVAFIDISTTGTSVGTVGDDTEHNITIPSFTFNGITYTNARVGANGVIVFGAAAGEITLTNTVLPTTSVAAGNFFLAPYWDDLDINLGGTIKTQTVGNMFVIAYIGMDHNLFTTGSISFEVQLDLISGAIHYVYPDVIFGSATYDEGHTATIGIEWASTSAIQYSFNTASLANNQSISFTPNASTIDYNWTGPNGFTSILQNPAITDAGIEASGVYNVTISTNLGCSASVSTASVTVNPRPTGVISGGAAYCEGSVTPTTLSIAVTGTGPWNGTLSDGTAFSGNSSPISVSVTPVPEQTTTYTIATLNDALCSSIAADLTGSATVTVNPLAANPTASVTQPTCALGTGSITMTAPLGTGNSYTLDGTTTISYPTVTFTGVAPGPHTITVGNSFGCSAPASASVTVDPQPFAPGTPVITGVVNVCPYLGTGEQQTYTAATTGNGNMLYTWTLPPNVVLVSGGGTNTSNNFVTVTFNTGLSDPAQANRQIRVTAKNDCGTSGIGVFYLLTQAPVTPNPITGPTNVCSLIGTSNTATYTINKVLAATGYSWSVPSNATFTSVNGTGVNDTSIVVTFPAGFAGGVVSVAATNGCGSNAVRTLTIVNTPPSTPALISGSTNVCANIAPGGTAATYSVAPVVFATSYTWTAPAGAVVTHPNGAGPNDNTITVLFPAGFSSGTISVTATNGCGTSAVRSLTITKLNPGTPSVIDIIQTHFCGEPGGRKYTYTLASMPANATSVLWTIPPGATMVSLSAISIEVTYPDGAVNGTVTAQGVNNCATSSVRSAMVHLPACPTDFAGNTGNNGSGTVKGNTLLPTAIRPMEVKIFPNPTVSDFKLEVLTSKSEEINVRVLDNIGRLYKSFKLMPYQVITLGAELKAGSYLIEVRQGNELKVNKVVKF